MARKQPARPQRRRISIDVSSELRRRLRMAAARRDLTLREYVTGAIQERLQVDLGDAEDEILALTAAADPVLAELWDNPQDAAYEEIA